MRASWQVLADAGIPSLADHTGPTNRPHVTLLAAEGLGGSADAPVRTAIGEAPGPLPALRLGGLVVFGAPPGGIVLARHIVVDAALMELHARIHTAVDGVSVIAHTRPGSWTPHISLALRLTTSQLADAVAALGRIDPLVVRARGLRRWDPRDRTVTDLA